MDSREYFPLSLDQTTVVLWAGSAPTGMLNLAVRIDIQDDIDEALFRKAISVTCERLPYARVRLHNQEDGTTVQYISTMEEQELPVWTDCTEWSEKKLTRQITK